MRKRYHGEQEDADNGQRLPYSALRWCRPAAALKQRLGEEIWLLRGAGKRSTTEAILVDGASVSRQYP
jgi:hypothetical protein